MGSADAPGSLSAGSAAVGTGLLFPPFGCISAPWLAVYSGWWHKELAPSHPCLVSHLQDGPAGDVERPLAGARVDLVLM